VTKSLDQKSRRFFGGVDAEMKMESTFRQKEGGQVEVDSILLMRQQSLTT